ncbi:MAG: glycoside hydrolase family 2 protein, partial [Stenotrophomonas sp.]|nr:glycoside hydrolase family 2 protein [Stenotrophomonas sp.]
MKSALLSLLLVGIVHAQTPTLPAPAELLLNSGWQFRLAPGDAQAAQHAEAAQWHRAGVPGNVHTDLLAAGLIPDPYVGAAESALQWIGLAQWEYRSTLDVDAATRKRAHADL